MEGLTCYRCGSEKVIPHAELVDRDANGSRQPLEARLGMRDPHALIFKGAQLTSLKAHLCCACGAVDIRLDAPEEAWEQYQSVSPDTRDVSPKDERQLGGLSITEERAGQISIVLDESDDEDA